MLRVIDSEHRSNWDAVVGSFATADIYQENFYSRALTVGAHEEPLLFSFEGRDSRIAFAAIKKDLSRSEAFCDILSDGDYYDMETPYGYGGPLCDGVFSDSDKALLCSELSEYCAAHRIVSLFVRFDPLAENVALFEGVSENRFVHNTIFIDTSSPDVIDRNLSSKNRNMIRKALKNDVVIEHVDLDDNQAFLEMYRATMDRHCASSEYYAFDERYFKALKEWGADRSTLVYAKKDGIVISGALFFFNDHHIHYHLSGSDFAYRNLAAGNLLLYEVAQWASQRGIKKMHLGGGVSDEDSLFKFKKQFNKGGLLDYHIGRIVFSESLYSELMEIRKRADQGFNAGNCRLIQYRA